MNDPERYIAPRTCTEVEARKSRTKAESNSRPLDNYSDVEAYVLLAPPGSGKTEELKRQARSCGGEVISARKFLKLKTQSEWHGRILFIDGLDEVRAGSADGRTSFDALCDKLQHLDNPRFRLSCREADWFGSNDRRHLQDVAPKEELFVLRLDPLPDSEIPEVLQRNHGVDDPDDFIEKARKRGVDTLLKNPLSLELLAKAVPDNEWPKSRIETFEMACKSLADEFNEEHQHATITDCSNTKERLNTAGQLCAVLLLAGAPGFRLNIGRQDNDYINLNELTGFNRTLQLESLKTRLFEAPNSEFAIPLHRQVAEFLGARYLAELVNEGLPVRRILALMSGYDGMIVTELRGLCAWLATLSLVARDEIIERDPLGTVLYGDLSTFSSESKAQILRNLNHLAKDNFWFISTIKVDSRLGGLVSYELAGVIIDVLEDPDRNDGRQSLVDFLVNTLVHAQPLDGVAEKLMKIIRDESRWPRIRNSAIKAFVQQRGDEEQALLDLKILMQDVYAGKVSDPDDDLLGRLLEATYPRVLSGTEVLDYLRIPRINQYLSNEVFWTLILPRQSDCAKIAELLDELAVRYDPLDAETQQTNRRIKLSTEVPLILLARFLADCEAASALEPQRLFNWLGVAGRPGDWNYDIGFSSEERGRVRSWLNERPELWKTLLKLGLGRCKDLYKDEETSDYQQFMWMEEDRRLFGANRPIDFAEWCLDQAVTSDDPNAARWLIRRVSDAIDDEKISRKTVDQHIEGQDFLKEALIERLRERKDQKKWERRLHKKEQQYEQEDQKEGEKELSQWQIAVRDNQEELENNRASVQLLHKLAIAYFGGYYGMTSYSPTDRLKSLLGNDNKLVESALLGLMGTVTRAELPSPYDVVRIGAEQHIQYLWFPFLAGYNELSKPIRENGFDPNESQVRLAVTLYFNVNFWPNPWGMGEAELEPFWLHALLKDEPKTVAEALIKTASARLRKGLDISNRMYQLAYSDRYKEMAQVAILPLLKMYPVRCKEQQMPGLRYLLIAAHRHCRNNAFLELIETKLAHQSMNVGQRVYWLAAGFLAMPNHFRKCLHDYVAGNTRRVTNLSQFIAGRLEYATKQSEQIDSKALTLLIQLLGAVYPPYSTDLKSDSDDEEGGKVTHEMDASFRVNEFISQLSRDSSADASRELMRLEREGSLRAWHTQLKYAVNHQKGIRRESEFSHADVSAILDVLENRRPANSADLAVLAMDCLNEIASNVRGGNTSDWRQYWNVDSCNRPERPKPEDACRDSVLSDLRQRLAPLSVDAQPEGRFADDKRADIRISYGELNVPVEIKRSCHRDLWTAIRNQLVAKYTRDPETGGYGIYLVFWFGNHAHCRPTPDAELPPKDADELMRRLEDLLSDAERRKISVCVIDVEDRKNQVMLALP